MRILLDLQGLQSASRHRGIGRLTGALGVALVDEAARTHDVHVLVNEALMQDLPAAADDILRRLPRANVHGFGPFPKVEGFDVANQWRAASAALVREAAIARLEPDIVHVSSLFEGFVDRAVTSIGRLDAAHATAVTLYDLIPLAAPDPYLRDPTYRRFYLRHVQDLKRADRLLAISDYTREEAEIRLQIPPAKISVIGAGVSPDFRPVQLDEADEADLRDRLGITGRFILHVGAVDPRKNVGVLVEAFGKLTRTLSAGRKLVFVGPISDEERTEIETLGRRFGLPAHAVVVAGQVSQADLVALYGLCEALVFPSNNEGFGLPPLEAMACGVPVLAANATSVPGVVGRRDCLFDPADARELSGLLERLLTDDAWRRDLREWGLTRAAPFSWERVARRTLTALEETVEARDVRKAAPRPLRRRPRMAFVSPLPPDQTGIADYSAELLRELLVFYDIDCIHPDARTSDPWIAANCGLKSVAWFRAHADTYDRVLYSVGNSMFHAHMFDLLVRIPGTVILHDAFLSDIAFHLHGGKAADPVLKELYRSHGLTGLRILREEGVDGVLASLTMSGAVLRNAQGVIVHSHHALSLAQGVLGPEAGWEIGVVPQLRSLPVRPDRAAARRRLDLAPDAFVVCSFGIVNPRKSNRLLAEAFVHSALADDEACLLLFVGEDNAPYSRAIMDEVVLPAGSKADVRFVGRVDQDTYALHLAAADVAVQLRTESRGETSRAVLDAMAHGVPTIVSDLGSAAELPAAAVIKIPVGTGHERLTDHLDRLFEDAAFRERIGAAGREQIARHHHPAMIAGQVRDLVDRFAAGEPRAGLADLMTALADIPASDRSPDARDLGTLSRQIGRLSPRSGVKQILCDVSAIARHDLRTGIERVVRAVVECLVKSPPEGYRIEPVIVGEDGYDYARRFSAERLGLSSGQDIDEPVEFGPGDHFLGLDWVPDRLPLQARWLDRLRSAGGTVTIVVYDLLPLEQPEFFPDWLRKTDERWLAAIVRSADRVACISAATADRVAEFAQPLLGLRTEHLPVGVFHLGHDLAKSRPTTGLPDDAEDRLSAFKARPTFLMVGTVEPRKGHDQVVAAFERLWAQGAELDLCIIGKEGWMVTDLADAIRGSGQFGRKLSWIPSASDEMLERAYEGAAALIAASLGEGFGLPLIEAAGHGLPVIARDIPVFREVGGSHAFYFQGREPEDLAAAIRAWLDLRMHGNAPASTRMHRQTWDAATKDLTRIMFGQRQYRVLDPAPPAAGDRRDRPERETVACSGS